MSWEKVNLADVDTTPKPVPDGTYTFRVMNAEYDQKFPGQLNINLQIADGDHQGRRIFASLPDPDKQDWAPKALKTLEVALGIDATDGEDPVVYLNRAASNGHSMFKAPLTTRSYTTQAGEPREKKQVMFFQAQPSV